jgi:hypothetical protein
MTRSMADGHAKYAYCMIYAQLSSISRMSVIFSTNLSFLVPLLNVLKFKLVSNGFVDDSWVVDACFMLTHFNGTLSWYSIKCDKKEEELR